MRMPTQQTGALIENDGDRLVRKEADRIGEGRRRERRQAPKAQLSVRWSTAVPWACSGDMYAAVPRIWPCLVSAAICVGDWVRSVSAVLLVVTPFLEGVFALATLQEWVRRGAPWPDEPPPAANVEAEVFDLAARRAEHWAWQPLTAPQVPGAEPANDSAAIDAFIRSELEEAGLEPAPVAEPEILVRRLSFALRGLPPSPDEVEAFLRDGRPDAWERLVDRWLASPH